jgi:hypothetical protein
VSELIIIPGSAEPITFTLSDGLTPPQPINFGAGTWSAKILVTRYPNDSDTPLFTWQTGVNGWLTLADSKIVLTPDPVVTELIEWTRGHFDGFLTGPNVSSKPIRFDHGPVRVDH